MLFSRCRVIARFVMLLTVCLVLPACSGNKRVTKENLALVKPGMSLADVEMILGKGEPEGGVALHEGSSVAGAIGVTDMSAGSRPASGPKWVKWGDDKKWIKVGFVGDRVGQGMIQQQGL